MIDALQQTGDGAGGINNLHKGQGGVTAAAIITDGSNKCHLYANTTSRKSHPPTSPTQEQQSET